MKRTQIYLPEELHRKLQHMAVREQTSISYIIRTAAEKHIEKHSPKKLDAVEFFKKIQTKKGPKDLSKKIDYYLYEEPNK